MPTTFKSDAKQNFSRPHWRHSLGTAFLGVVFVISTLLVLVNAGKAVQAVRRASPSSFGFTFAGDYDQTSFTALNLQKIKQLANAGQINFNIGLGDFSYAKKPNNKTADAWSTNTKSNLPTGFPFEIVDGRHDSSEIARYETDLPDLLGEASTNCQQPNTPAGCVYGQEYYTDFPSTGTPLARFIMLSPNQTIPGYTYNYTNQGADYLWVQRTIENARTSNIPWVIVGMHQYCFAAGYASCLNQDLLDLLLKEHVDVILQGQKHNYQRSMQLALNPTATPGCTTLDVNNYNSNCVADLSDSLTQGKGTVIVLSGTGGSLPLLPIDLKDPKAQYFKTLNDTAWGVAQFTITPTQLTEQFDAVSGTNSDSFTITANPVATPTPSPSPSPSPSPTVSGTPGTILGQDSFQRPNGTGWGTANVGGAWTGDANNLTSVFSINNNTGVVAANTTKGYSAILGPSASNAEVLLSGSISAFSKTSLATVIDWTDINNHYKAYIDGSNLVIAKKVGGKLTRLGYHTFTASAKTSYTIRFNVTNGVLSAKVWPTIGTEPGGWMVTVSDTSFSSGNCGLLLFLNTSNTASITSFQATAH